MSINEDRGDDTSSMSITAEFGEGSTHEERMRGAGMMVTLNASSMSHQEVVNALLMAAEQLVSQQVREMHEAQQTALMAPLDKVVSDSIVALNARVLMMGFVSELRFAPSAETFGFSIPDHLE